MRRVRVLAAGLATLLSGGAVGAKECGNPCGLESGGLCTSLFRKGQGYVPGLVAPGQALRLHPGRQRGTCGGLEPLLADQVTVTWATDPQGPFRPLGADTDERRPLWQPAEAGAYFLIVAPAAGRPDDEDRMLVVADPRREPVQVRIQAPGESGWLALRRAPAQVEAALAAGFSRRRWPVIFQGAMRPGPLALELSPGPYEVEWRSGNDKLDETALVPLAVAGPGEVMARVPHVATRITPRPAPAPGAPGPQPWDLVVVEGPGGIVAEHCFGSGAPPWALHTEAGPLRMRWYRGTGHCPPRRPTGPPVQESTVRAGTRIRTEMPSGSHG